MTLTRTWNILQCTGTDRECEAQESLVLVGQHVSEALGQALAESRQLYDAAVLDLRAVSELAKLVLAVHVVGGVVAELLDRLHTSAMLPYVAPYRLSSASDLIGEEGPCSRRRLPVDLVGKLVGV